MQAVLAVEMPDSDSDSDTNSDEVAAALMAMELQEVVFGNLQQALVVPVHPKSDQELLVPPVGKMYFGYGHRLVSETEQACAVIALGSCLPPMRISTRNTVPPHTRTLVY